MSVSKSGTSTPMSISVSLFSSSTLAETGPSKKIHPVEVVTFVEATANNKATIGSFPPIAFLKLSTSNVNPPKPRLNLFIIKN